MCRGGGWVGASCKYRFYTVMVVWFNAGRMPLLRYAGRHLKSDLETADRQLASATGNQSSSANDFSTVDGPNSAEVSSRHNQRSHQPERHLSTAKEQLTAGSLFTFLASAEQRYKNEVEPLQQDGSGGGGGGGGSGTKSSGSSNSNNGTGHVIIQDLKFVYDNFEKVAGPPLARVLRTLVPEMAAVLERDAAVAAATAEGDNEVRGEDAEKAISRGPTNANDFLEVLEAALSRAKRRSGRMPTQALFPAREIASQLERERRIRKKKKENASLGNQNQNRPSRQEHFNQMYESAQQANDRLAELREAKMAAESVGRQEGRQAEREEGREGKPCS